MQISSQLYISLLSVHPILLGRLAPVNFDIYRYIDTALVKEYPTLNRNHLVRLSMQSCPIHISPMEFLLHSKVAYDSCLVLMGLSWVSLLRVPLVCLFLKPAETKLATKRHKINAFDQILQVYILQLDEKFKSYAILLSFSEHHCFCPYLLPVRNHEEVALVHEHKEHNPQKIRRKIQGHLWGSLPAVRYTLQISMKLKDICLKLKH